MRYVFANIYKHNYGLVAMHGKGGRLQPDPYSSGVWFLGFSETDLDRTALAGVERCTAPAESWLLRVGWLRSGGRFSILERPAAA